MGDNMLDIDMTSGRGILFVRLKGILNRRSSNKLHIEVTKLLKNIGIKNIVFNIDELSYIDKYGVRAIKTSFKICTQNNGKTFICTDKKPSPIISKFQNTKVVTNELEAVKVIHS